MDCGQHFHFSAMQFDHVVDNKMFNLSDAAHDDIPFPVIQEEIAKCEVVCANCHSIRSHQRQRQRQHHRLDIYRRYQKG